MSGHPSDHIEKSRTTHLGKPTAILLTYPNIPSIPRNVNIKILCSYQRNEKSDRIGFSRID